jgi:hypothetical protein
MGGVEVSLMIVAKPQTWLLATADPRASARRAPRQRR